MAPLGAAECLRSGVTTLVDAAYGGASVRACSAAGLRAIVAIEAFGGDDADVAGRGGRARAARRRARRRGRPAASSSPFSPHAPYTVGLALFGEIVARARARGHARRHAPRRVARTSSTRWSRGTGVLARSVAPYGRHPILELAERGLLGPETVVAHAVHVGDEEIAALAASGAAVAHCPRSNAAARLRRRAARAPARGRRARRASAPTARPRRSRWTCSTSCAPRCCWRARAPAIPRRSRRDSALQLATLDGARALGLDDRGALAPGLLADLVAVRLDGTPFWPCDDPVSALVLGGSPALVTLVAIGGKPLYMWIRPNSSAPSPPRRTRARASSNPRPLLRHDHLDPQPQGLGRRHLLRPRPHLRPVVHHRRRRHGQQRLALRHLQQTAAASNTSSTPTPEPRASATLQKIVKAKPEERAGLVGPRRRLRERQPPERRGRAPGSTSSSLKPTSMDSLQRLALAQAQVATNQTQPGPAAAAAGLHLVAGQRHDVLGRHARLALGGLGHAGPGGRGVRRSRPSCSSRPSTAADEGQHLVEALVGHLRARSSSCRPSPRTTWRRRSGSTTAPRRRARTTPRRRSPPTPPSSSSHRTTSTRRRCARS